jgi:hypothetical protein
MQFYNILKNSNFSVSGILTLDRLYAKLQMTHISVL